MPRESTSTTSRGTSSSSSCATTSPRMPRGTSSGARPSTHPIRRSSSAGRGRTSTAHRPGPGGDLGRERPSTPATSSPRPAPTSTRSRRSGRPRRRSTSSSSAAIARVEHRADVDGGAEVAARAVLRAGSADVEAVGPVGGARPRRRPRLGCGGSDGCSGHPGTVAASLGWPRTSGTSPERTGTNGGSRVSEHAPLDAPLDAPPRLRVGVVGTGRAGAVLGAALARAGHVVVAAYAVSEMSRLRAEALLPGVPLLPVADVIADVDLALLTVPDDVLPGLVQGLADTGAIRAGQFLAHASGRFGYAVLDPATRLGALPLALHPVMTFTGTSIDLARLTGAPFGVTAPEQLRPVAEALVVEMGGDPVWVERGQPGALPRGPRARREPPRHPGLPDPGAAARGRCRRAGAARGAAALGRARQRAALRRLRADRTCRARRRRHGRRAPARARPGVARGARHLRRPGPRHGRPGARRGAACGPPPQRPCSTSWPRPEEERR